MNKITNDFLSLMLDSTGEGILALDSFGVCTYANRAALNLLGCDQLSDLTTGRFHDVVVHSFPDGSVNDTNTCSICASLKSGKSAYCANATFWKRDKSSIMVSAWCYPMPNDTSNGLVIVFDDITNRENWERDQSILSAIINESYDAIISKNLDGLIIHWNVGAEKIYGYTAEEMIGKSIAMIVPAGVNQEEAEILDVINSGKTLKDFETTRIRKDGSIIDVSMTVSPIRDKARNIIGTSTIERDITDRRREINELREAKREALLVNKLKNDFISNISHELRTPLNSIIGMLELGIVQVQENSLLYDQLATAYESSRLLLALVNDLLDISRLETEKLEIVQMPFILQDVIAETLRILSMRTAEKGLELICWVDDKIPHKLVGDAKRFKQVLMNLAGNAIKFTESGEVIIWVSLGDDADIDSESCRINLSISDTGIGIPEQYQAKLFEPFFQVDSSSTRKYGGAGLGLKICKDFVERMGGEITIDSQLGIGTTVKCYMIFGQATQEFSASTFHKTQEFKNHHTLIVEDNPSNAQILSSMIQFEGGTTHTCITGFDALSSLMQSGIRYQHLIIDYTLPDMTGIELIKRITAEKFPVSNIVLMFSPADKLKIKSHSIPEISAYLEKPVIKNDLVQALRMKNQIHKDMPDKQDHYQLTVSKVKLLVVDDMPANRKVVCTILRQHGYEVDIAVDGVDALHQIANHDYHLILMDVQMPVMDGVEATRKLRKMPNRKKSQIPVIALTAHVMKEDRQHYLSVGMNDYLSKPIDVPLLLKYIERYRLKPDRSFSPQLTPEQDTPEEVSMNQSDEVVFEAINIPETLERMGGDKSLMIEMMQIFLEDYPLMLQTLEKAIAENNRPEMGRLAHSIKGLVANFGAEQAVQTSARLEQKSLHTTENVDQLFETMQADVNRVLNDIKKLVN